MTRGGVIRITVWMVTRERRTWITAAEILALGLVLLVAPGPAVRLVVGVPLLLHLGYRALTSLPMGAVPGRPPEGRKRSRYDLRSRVAVFLREVRRAADHVQQAKDAGRPAADVDETLRSARRRMITAAAQVAKAMGSATG